MAFHPSLRSCRLYHPQYDSSSWTEKIRSAIIKLLPADQQLEIKKKLHEETFAYSKTSSPSSVSARPPTSSYVDHDVVTIDQYQQQIKSLSNIVSSTSVPRSVPLEDLMHLYPQFRGSLSEDVTVLLSIVLYHHGQERLAAKVLLDNLSLGISLFSAFCSKLIPDLAVSYGQKMVLGAYVRAFVSLGHSNTAYQLLQELGHSEAECDEHVRNATLILELKQSKFMDDYAIIQYIHDFTASEESNGRWAPQLFAHADFDISTRTEIFSILLNKRPDFYLDLIMRRFSKNFLSQPHVLQAVILSKKHKNWWTADRIRLFCSLLNQHYCEYSAEDLQYIASIPNDAKQFSKLFKSYKQYHKKRSASLSQAENDMILSQFLSSAIKYEQTLTVTEVIKLGAVNNPRLVSGAIDCVLWGKTRTSTDPDDSALFSKKTSDPRILHRIFKNVSRPVLDKALVMSMNRLGSSPPGKILWDFIGGLESWAGLETMPVAFERAAANAISARPHFEQMRYMALKKVSPNGVMALLHSFISRLHQTPQNTEDKYDSDVKIIMAGLVLLKEKGDIAQNQVINDAQSNMVSTLSTDGQFGKVVTDLFRRWDEERATEVIQFLVKRDIQPPSDAIIRSVGMLVHRNQFSLALKLLDSIPEIPPKAYFLFLIRASRSFPNICKSMMKWLKINRDLHFPPSVIRQIIVGYSRSPLLSAAQCNNRVVPLVADLRARGQPLGPKTAEAIVEGILRRVTTTGKGSRARLLWAIDIAKEEGVDPKILHKWVRQVEVMRADGHGFWRRGARS